MPNKKAERVLVDYLGEGRAEYAVNLLIEAGLIEDVPKTDPEILAERATKWLGTYETAVGAFNKASGWSTDSWRIVMDDFYSTPEEKINKKYQFETPTEIRYIFEALVILAKEAGIEI